MYKVLIERSAERDLKSLPTPLFHRSFLALERSQPIQPIWLPQLVGSKNDWRIRIGDYRAVDEINARFDISGILETWKFPSFVERLNC